LKDYGLEEEISEKRNPEEARLDNLNKLMVHFGVRVLPPAVLLEFSHPFLTYRLVTDCILDRGKDR